jgi:hypothetical protein
MPLSLSFSLGAKNHPWHSRLKTRPSHTNKIILVHCAMSGSSILATGGVGRRKNLQMFRVKIKKFSLNLLAEL